MNTAMNSVSSAVTAPDWFQIGQRFCAQTPLLNLNNAAVSPPTRRVQQAVIEALNFVSQNPDHNMWSDLDTRLPGTKNQLAALVDAAPEEIALNRNSSEGLSAAIFGIPLNAGDEVLVSPWDYPSALGGWSQRARREGIVPVMCDYGLTAGFDEIVEAYEKAITPKTRVLHLTHIVHWNGLSLPVESLCALARSKGIVTLVDGAQSFAQMPLSFREIGCDYFVTSLHKWLGAPITNGMLIVRRDMIGRTWSHMAPYDDDIEVIDKFDHWNLGTYNSALQAAIPIAIEDYNSIGPALMQERLGALTRYWTDLAQDVPGFTLLTDLSTRPAGAISLFRIEGADQRVLETRLRDKHAIHVKYRKVGNIEGMRVSPHIYTQEEDLKRFVDVLHDVVRTTQ